MPSVRRIPDDKRRSRTGCLPCRKRRRKCDEKKPQCANCLARNVSCAYQDWTFVSEGTPARVSRARAQRAVVSDDGDHDGVVINTPGPGSSVGTLPESSQQLTPPSANLSVAAHAQKTSSDDAGQRAVFLTHFRYQMAAWMDSVAPRSTFATDLLVWVHDHPALLNAVAELVARHDRGLAGHVEEWRRRRQVSSRNASTPCSNEETITAVTDALVSLQAFFGAPVVAWRAVAGSYVLPPAQRDDRGLLYMAQPLQTLVRLHCKIDIASALLGQTASQLRLPISTAPVTAPDGSGLAPLAFYDACLAQLVACLAFCARDAPPQEQSSQTWRLLWTRCLRWYETRPPAMTPIAASGRLTGSMSEALVAPFPAEVYTSVLAVQASVVLHVAMGVLLTLKQGQVHHVPARLTSRHWHAQAIAAIALSNQFPEQSDPVVVAALLWVARDMTHPLQQGALVSLLERTAGMDLRDALAQLQGHWMLFK